MDSQYRHRLQVLEASISRLSTQDEKLAKISLFLQDGSEAAAGPLQNLSGSTNSIHTLTQHNAAMAAKSQALIELMRRHGLPMSKLVELTSAAPHKDSQPPLKNLLCAYQNVEQRDYCKKLGKLSCSGCLLVRYCSKECQRRHWSTHKQDCKNSMNKASWKPQWEVQGRTPAFINNDKSSDWRLAQYGMGIILWGNMPAINIINGLKSPQGLRDRDLSLAFVASGDLRNVIKTVNSLPEDYTGKLKILLNDRNPLIVARNVLMLSILGLLPDIEVASESVLHLWYSIFLPIDFLARALLPFSQHQILKQNFDGEQIELTPKTTISTTLESETVQLIHANMITSQINPAAANNALNSVMNAPERVDYRDRFYFGLKPAHRVAFQEFRRFGITMPFGAVNAHLNVPNPTLVTPNGKVFLNDNASPLQGWDIPDMLKAGVDHGTTEQDIMGCFYFYVKDQLKTFAKRLRQFNVDIRIYDTDALTLPADLPQNFQPFDRIEVSNIVDKEYAGTAEVLKTWGPLLNPTQPDSAIIGLFMNWAAQTPDATPRTSAKIAADCFMKLGKYLPQWGLKVDLSEMMKPTSPINSLMFSSLDLVFDHSKVFRKYLKDEKAGVAARKAGLKMRETNEIVPHRLGARLGSTWDTLPSIETHEDWYKEILAGSTHTERYVEWERMKQ